MLNNTKIFLEVKPVGESTVFYSVILPGNYNTDKAEKDLDWGHKYNFIISDIQYNSKYYSLDNWKVLKVEETNFDVTLEPIVLNKNLQSKEDIERHKHFENVTARFVKNLKKNKVKKNNFDDNYLKSLKGQNCWIDPGGKVYKLYGFAQHNSFAIEYLQNEGFKHNDLEFGQYHYEVLEKRGWIRLLWWSETSKDVCIGLNKKPNYHQIEFVNDWCFVNELPQYI